MPDIQALIACLDSTDLQTRLDARRQLIELSETAVDPLIALLERGSGWGSAEAAIALGEIGDPRALRPLSNALNTGSLAVLRQNAAQALGDLGDLRALDTLMAALPREVGLVQVWIVNSLGKLRDRRAVKPLLDALYTAEPTNSVRYLIIRALGEIGDPQVLDAILTFKEDADHHVRADVEKAVAKLQKA
jgi:HEAT repeat protein